MRKAFFFTVGWTYAVLCLPLLGVAALLSRLGFRDVGYSIAVKYMRTLAKLMLILAGVKVRVEGTENLPQDLPVVFVSSHQGHFDSAVILAYLKYPVVFVASSNAAKFPIISQWFNLGKTVYMERDNLRQNYQAVKEAQAAVESGHCVVIFPEGIISKKAEMGEFRRGSFKVATEPGVPIVPLVIDGTWKVMGSNSDTIQPADVVLRILPQVPTAGLTKQEQHELPQKVFESIEKNLKEIQQRSSTKRPDRPKPSNRTISY